MIMMYVVFGGDARSSGPLDGVRCGAGGSGSGQVLDGGWIAGGLVVFCLANWEGAGASEGAETGSEGGTTGG